MTTFKKCEKGHYYSADLEKCPYCADEFDLRRRLSDISKDDSYSFPPVENAMCYGQMPPDRENMIDNSENGKKKSEESHRQVGWLIEEDGGGVNYKLYEGRNIIGRDLDCQITIADKKVSRRHAVILFRAGKYSIIDQQSTEGTFVNNEDIELEPRYINDGDIITVGNTRLKFRSYVDDEHT